LGDPQGSRKSRVPAPQPATHASTIVVAISGPIASGDVPGLRARVQALLEDVEADELVCEVSALVDPDCGTVDALAQLQLTARRYGCQIRLLHACRELQELLVLTGLCDVLPNCAELPLQSRGQPEEREPARGIEEEADPGDPAG
jgi:ABC-type transporter Mla MlaB component